MKRRDSNRIFSTMANHDLPGQTSPKAVIIRLAADGINSRRVLVHPAGAATRRVQPHKTMAAD